MSEASIHRELQEVPSSPEDEHLVVERATGIAEAPDAAVASETQVTAHLTEAKQNVGEAFAGQKLEKVIGSLDFDPKNYKFIAMDSYHAEALTGARNTRVEGKGDLRRPYYSDGKTEKWGNPRDEAHYSGKPAEKVGIREVETTKWIPVEKRVAAPGVFGKLGFTKKVMKQEAVKGETIHVLDYEFAAPSHKRENNTQADLDAGNRTGQNLQLSVKLTKEQAFDLSNIIAKDPRAARSVLDAFVAKTGDVGKWNAEIFDKDGEFHDPGARYGVDNGGDSSDSFAARDVRPRYDAVPDLTPEVVGLVGVAEQPSEDKTPASTIPDHHKMIA